MGGCVVLHCIDGMLGSVVCSVCDCSAIILIAAFLNSHSGLQRKQMVLGQPLVGVTCMNILKL